ncbi:MAG: hypothetical protein ACI89U_001387 [Gammaproteobacteria bacterium]|jgi:hypothetical protein
MHGGSKLLDYDSVDETKKTVSLYESQNATQQYLFVSG